MATKKIGLPFWKVGDNSFGSTLNYIMYAERFGEVIPLMPNHTVREDLDLLILPGGADIDPLRFNQTPGWYTGKADMFKEHFDKVYLPQYINNNTPILGICRGHQSLWVEFGGELIQNFNHETNDYSKDQYSPVHGMSFTNEFYNKHEFSIKFSVDVNSRHHQVCEPTKVPKDLQILAVHTATKNYRDNAVEMFAHKQLPIVGIQSHPEDYNDFEAIKFMDNVIMRLINTKTSILK